MDYALRVLNCAVVLAGLFLLGILPASAQDRAKIKIVFPTNVTTYMLPYLVAKDQGWLGEHGIDAEEIYLNGDPNAARAVMTGEADMGLVGMQTLFDLAIAGSPAKAVLSWQPIVDYQMVVRKGLGSLADLKGKVIAAGAPGDIATAIPQMILKKHGVDPNSAQYVNIGGHAARMQAVAAGKADGTMINSITAKEGERQGALKILQAVTDDFPKLGYGFVLVSNDSMKNEAKRRAYTTLIEGSIIGARRVIAEPEMAIAVMQKRLPNMDKDLVRDVVLELNRLQVWGIDGGLDPSTVTVTASVSREMGMLKKEIAPGDVFDDSLIKDAVKKLGK